jgi:hypothetical protein
MHKLYLSMALLMSLVLGTGFAISGNSVSAQSYAYNDDQAYDRTYSDNSYSKYKTQDKPYECQRGPFQGFFVSSAEFCKASFDDRKDRNHDKDHNNDNNRVEFDFYVVTSTETESTAGSAVPIEATATCNEGDQVTGGGFEIREIDVDTTGPVAEADITSSEPFPEGASVVPGAAEGWEAELDIEQPPGSSTNTFGLVAYAVCFAEEEEEDNGFTNVM